MPHSTAHLPSAWGCPRPSVAWAACGGPSHKAFLCRYGGLVLAACEGAIGDPPEAAEEGGEYQPLSGPHVAPSGRQPCPSQILSAQMAERWLPRAEEGLWPEEEDRLEDSLEDLEAAGGAYWGRPG